MEVDAIDESRDRKHEGPEDPAGTQDIRRGVEDERVSAERDGRICLLV